MDVTNIRRLTLALLILVAGAVLPAPSAAEPVIAESVELTRTGGKVSVVVPGGQRRRIGSRTDIPVGSVVDTRKGSVVVTAAIPGGELRSADAAGAKFRVTQSRGPNSATTLTVIPPDRTACARALASVVPTSGPLKVRVPPRRRRGRAATATVGQFITAGQFETGANRGRAQWEATEGCGSSTVLSQQGVVAADSRDFSTEEMILRPGFLWIVSCARAGQKPVTGRYCQTFLGQEFSGGSVLFGAGLYAVTDEDRYEMCVTGPSKVPDCHTWALSAPAQDRERNGIVVCAVPQRGRYSVTWRLRGETLQLQLPPYTARKASNSVPKCSGGFGADTFPPGRQKVPLRPNSTSVNQYALPTAGTISSLDLSVVPANLAGVAYLTGVVYADENGAPGALLGTSERITVTRDDPEDLKEMFFRPPVPVPAGPSWVGVMTQGTANLAFYRYEPGATLAIGLAVVPGVANNPFGPIATENNRMSLNGRYELLE